MGTRHLTIVKSKGLIKVAQYGQWDGYPKGQGQTIADFLAKVDLDKFKKQVDALGVYSEEDIDKAYEDAGHDGKSDWCTTEVSDKVKKVHPALSRDYGADILNLIHAGLVSKVQLNEKFKEDTLFCEYWYGIDLDKETVSLNGKKTFSFKHWMSKGMMSKLEKSHE